MDQRSPSRGPTLPRDLLAEIEQELDLARVGAQESRERLAELTILHRIAADAATDLGRPITLIDFLSAARDEIDRRSRVALVGKLRRSA